MKGIFLLIVLHSFAWINAVPSSNRVPTPRLSDSQQPGADAVQFGDTSGQIPVQTRGAPGRTRPQSVQLPDRPQVVRQEQEQFSHIEREVELAKESENDNSWSVDANSGQKRETGKECGRPGEASKSIGGQIAPEGKYPWVTALIYYDANNKSKLSCSGVLVSKDLVLTTAECLKKRVGIPDEIRVGTTRLDKNKFGGQALNTLIGFSSKTYEKEQLKDNIALVLLEDAVDIGAQIQPVCIADKMISRSSDALNHAETASWKFTRSDGGRLLTFKSEIADGKECKGLVRNGGTITEDQICVVTRGPDGLVCDDDVGAPLMIEVEGQIHVMGILSHADKCSSENPANSSAAIYTKISHYSSWIQGIITRVERLDS